MTAKQFNAWLKSHNACSEGMAWVDGRSIKKIWDDFERSDWMIWLLDEADIGQMKLIGISCKMVRETPLVDGRKVWDLLTDERSRTAVEMAEKFTRGECSLEEVSNAANAAASATYAAAYAANAADAAANAAASAADATYAAANAAASATYAAAYAAASATYAAAYAANAADAAANAAASAAYAANAAAYAYAAARKSQCSIIRSLITVKEVEALIMKQIEAKK